MTRRLLFVILAACAIGLLAMVGVAGADGGPHGGYTPTTDGCAGCHRAHTAQAPSLLTTPVASLCMSCHGSAATGADTNVEDGQYLERDGVTEAPGEGVVNLGLKGGGFVNAFMDTDFSGGAVAAPATSAHTHDGALGTAWGNGAIGSGPGLANFSLECTNCHDPHGNGNYRILRGIPTASLAGTAVNVADEGTKDYTVTDGNSQYFGEGRTSAFGNDTQYEGLSTWCSQCHTRYAAASGSGGDPASGDAIFAYRHMAGDGAATCSDCHSGAPSAANVTITFNGTYWNHQVDCMTCHVAHGSSADVTTDGPYSSLVPWPDGTAGPGDDTRSSLLRADGRGVCQACHNKPGTPTP